MAMDVFRSLDVGGQLEELALTVFLEAEGESPRGKLGVASCIMNRVRDPRFPDNPAAVVHQKWQFSCHNDDMEAWRDKRLEGHAHDPNWTDSWRAAAAAFFGFERDPTGGSCHYCTQEVAESTSWAKGKIPAAIIGSHNYYSTVR